MAWKGRALVSRDILERPAPVGGVRLAYGRDPRQFGDLRRPTGSGPHPVVVVIHGGFWRARHRLEYMGHACAALTDLGAVTWNVEYRRIGDPGGAWPGTFLDVAMAVEHIRVIAGEYDLDLRRVVAIGHSAGGHLALWLAARHRLADGELRSERSPLALGGAVSLAGVVDLRRAWELRLSDNVVEELIGGPPARLAERYVQGSPIELLPLGVPQVLLHGTADERVPFEISVAYQRRAQELGDDARLVTLEGAGHFEVVDPRSAEWPSVVAAVMPLAERRTGLTPSRSGRKLGSGGPSPTPPTAI